MIAPGNMGLIRQVASRLVLGTVQLGMDYGISNLKGKPSRDSSMAVLSAAWEAGIRYFDTAPVYGSEQLLGEFIQANGLQSEIKILTKIPPVQNWTSPIKEIECSLESSLSNLRMQQVEVYFFHEASDARLIRSPTTDFLKWVQSAPVGTLGVSMYERREAEGFQDASINLAIQIPFNAVNRDFEDLTWPKGQTYLRSVFLQGLLASATAIRHDAPLSVVQFHRRYHALMSQRGMNPKAYALSVALNLSSQNRILVGVDSKEQLQELLDCPILDEITCGRVPVQKTFTDPRVVDPRSWYES